MPASLSPRFQQAVDACRKARDNMPQYPTALLDSLGACIGDNWKKHSQPNFKGWMWFVGGCPGGLVPNNVGISIEDPEDGCVPDYIDLDDIYYIGIWRGRTQSKTHVVYCVIPSMLHGEVPIGATFEIGDEKIRIGQYTQEQLDDLVRKGWDIMQQLINEKGRYVPGE